MMNNYAKFTQNFIIELIHIYRLISQELKNIPFFKHGHNQLINNITQTIIGCNCIDRSIRRQNQLRLFKETLASIQKYSSKKGSVKKSQLTIKYTLVCEVLFNRLKELLKMPEQLKQKILRKVQQSKQLFLQWSQGKKQKTYIPNKPKATKETDNYILKFTFTQATRSTVVNVSSFASPTMTPIDQNETINMERKTQKKDRKYPLSLNNSNIWIKPEKEELSFANGLRKGRKTVKFQRSILRSSTTPVRSKTMKKTIIPKTMIPPKSLITDSKIEVSESSQNSQISQNSQNQDREKLQFKRNKKNLTIQNNIFSQKESNSNEDNIDSKKQQFYISQKYIKSKKNIDNVSLLAKKIKKRSVNIEFNVEVLEKQQKSQEYSDRDFVIQPTNIYRSKKYFTRKVIPSEKQVQNPIKSERNIKNGKGIDFNEIVQKNKLKRVPRKSKCQRVSVNNPSLSRIDSPHNKIESQNNAKSHMSNLRNDEIIIEGENQEKIMEGSKSSRQNFRNFYNQLGDIRKNIREESDPYLKDFSVFFRQQKQMSDQQNKQFQEILCRRKKDHPKEQFDIRCYVTQKPPHYVEDFREAAYIESIRNNLIECEGVYQIGPLI